VPDVWVPPAIIFFILPRHALPPSITREMDRRLRAPCRRIRAQGPRRPLGPPAAAGVLAPPPRSRGRYGLGPRTSPTEGAAEGQGGLAARRRPVSGARPGERAAGGAWNPSARRGRGGAAGQRQGPPPSGQRRGGAAELREEGRDVPPRVARGARPQVLLRRAQRETAWPAVEGGRR
jgi:hypothetical protein